MGLSVTAEIMKKRHAVIPALNFDDQKGVANAV